MSEAAAADGSRSEGVKAPPIFVDLDGTLIRSDLLYESFAIALRRRPFRTFAAVPLVFSSIAKFKEAIAEFGPVSVAELPYSTGVIEYLKQQKSTGRTIILATAASQSLAHAVREHLQLFDGVIASSGGVNYKGKRKLEAICEYCKENNLGDSFSYIGDARADLPIWHGATEAVVVGDPTRFGAALSSHRQVISISIDRKPQWRSIVRLVRPHQWAKNVLIFVPLLASHRFFEFELVIRALIAFVCMCSIASMCYVVNDLLDIESDRRHETKRRRPLASGDLALILTAPIVFLLFAVGMMCAMALGSWKFAFLAALYVVTTMLYSWDFKRRLLFDVMVLAGLYTLRVLAGGAATGIAVSDWLLAFSFFLFSSLAFAKRFTELKRVAQSESDGGRRAYAVGDANVLAALGISTGMMAVMVFSLYVSSENVRPLYGYPRLLWLNCPLLLYWIGRIWLFASRGALHDDPLTFTLTDRVSILVLALVAAIALLAWKMPVLLERMTSSIF